METQKSLADKLFPIIKDAEELELKNVPPEQRRLHTETADLTVASIHQYLVSGKIEIPEFQRGYVWTRTQASRLIESLIIQCPIPVIYFSQSSDNKLIVIDGNQRLLTIKLFLNDAFELQGLTTYPELNGQRWTSLDPRFRDHINNRTLRCITILKDTHPQIKFDVFERLNTGSVKLNAQELRHGINFGTLMDRIDDLAKMDLWKKTTGFRSDKRMKGAELILRYFSFRHNRSGYEKPLSSFLDQFSAVHRNIDKPTLDRWTKEFEEALNRTFYALQNLAYRMFDQELHAVGLFNSALFDAQMIAFSETENAKILSKDFSPESFQKKACLLFEDDKFVTSIREATSDEQAVKTRIETYKRFVDGF
ncbi:DUF262 domain-containing protein [Bradyrhizobium sp. HKCCYLR1023]|uniref:DUF262 domain-containing protein n=1 Tax=Bradyrhizobium TaxID=374 RepID=UPI003EB72088